MITAERRRLIAAGDKISQEFRSSGVQEFKSSRDDETNGLLPDGLAAYQPDYLLAA
jgi:hypothetical protein